MFSSPTLSLPLTRAGNELTEKDYVCLQDRICLFSCMCVAFHADLKDEYQRINKCGDPFKYTCMCECMDMCVRVRAYVEFSVRVFTWIEESIRQGCRSKLKNASVFSFSLYAKTIFYSIL